jgi:hypothetical protein
MIKFTRSSPINIEEKLPSFAETCKYDNCDVITVHQDFFKENENELIGAAINFACLHGKTVIVIPKQKLISIFKE